MVKLFSFAIRCPRGHCRHRTTEQKHSLRWEEEKMRKSEPLKVLIYINGRPIEDYPPDELEELKIKITDKMMDAAGYRRAREGE